MTRRPGQTVERDRRLQEMLVACIEAQWFAFTMRKYGL
jgi:hypothetical protein